MNSVALCILCLDFSKFREYTLGVKHCHEALLVLLVESHWE